MMTKKKIAILSIVLGIVCVIGGCTPAVSKNAPPMPSASDRSEFIENITHTQEYTDEYIQNKYDYDKVRRRATAHPGVFEEFKLRYASTFANIRARIANVEHEFNQAKDQEFSQDRTLPEQSELPDIPAYSTPWNQTTSVTQENSQDNENQVSQEESHPISEQTDRQDDISTNDTTKNVNTQNT